PPRYYGPKCSDAGLGGPALSEPEMAARRALLWGRLRAPGECQAARPIAQRPPLADDGMEYAQILSRIQV
ncbi:MAG: hypothetical protein AAFQ98_22470, partial [Bacteroidota bacterium]